MLEMHPSLPLSLSSALRVISAINVAIVQNKGNVNIIHVPLYTHL